jgi:hypothetical protein
MQPNTRWLAVALLLAAAQISACGKSSPFNNTAAGNGPAAKVETIKGTSTVRIVLSATAARRLGIETARVRREPATVHGSSARHGGAVRTAIPYAAVLYGPDGNTFTFTSPSPLVYVPRLIDVDHISGQVAVLRRGPPVGTDVVTTGSAELLGVEYGVEEG